MEAKAEEQNQSLLKKLILKQLSKTDAPSKASPVANGISPLQAQVSSNASIKPSVLAVDPAIMNAKKLADFDPAGFSKGKVNMEYPTIVPRLVHASKAIDVVDKSCVPLTKGGYDSLEAANGITPLQAQVSSNASIKPSLQILLKER